MIQINLTGKTKKILLFIFIAALTCSFLCMTLAVQKVIHKVLITGIFHKSGSFEYWREILLNFSFTFSVLFAFPLLIISTCNKIELNSGTVFALIIFLSFALTQPLFMFNRWQTGLTDSSYDFGDMFSACSKSINMGEDHYPPSGMLIYQIMRNTYPGIGQAGAADYTAIITSPISGYYIQLFFLLTAVPLAITCFFAIGGTKLEKSFFAVAILLSRPIMIGFERGNSILWALSFVMIFYICYRSQNKLYHEIALIALAVAFSLKIYTAIFGVLLLKNKDYKSAVRCSIYALFLFIFPACCHRCGFIESFKLYINALTSYTADLDFGLEAAQLSLKRIVTLFTILINAPDTYNIFYPIFMVVFVAAFAFLILFSKKEYQILLSCSLAAIIIPSLSWPYTAAFMLVPLISLLNEKEKSYAEYLIILCILWIFMFIYYEICGFTRMLFKLNNWWIPLVFALIFAVTDTFIKLNAAKKTVRKL